MFFIKSNFKFILIIFFLFFGPGVMTVINSFDFDENKTGIIYQENNNIVLSEENKIYNKAINYDLEESYLHYSPVKKTGFLEGFGKGKNLAVPDLTDKEYLSNGIYHLRTISGVDIYYNEYNGVYTFNGVSTGNSYLSFLTINPLYDNNSLSVYYVSGSVDNTFRFYFTSPSTGFTNIINGQDVFNTNLTFNGHTNIIFNTNTTNPITFDNYQVKIQIEKGSGITAYEVPYIPPLKIEFQGSNQVELINPYEEHIIKIDNINNVNNINFDLLNTNNNIVFKWNIKTNEDLPFLRYYNEENKLIYDFTDLDEINSIGDTIVINTAGFQTIFEGVINLVDMFYTGFQHIFSIANVEDLAEALKIRIPVPILPWNWKKGVS